MARKTRPQTDPHEWVNLINFSGPFPGDNLLKRFWPDGLDRHADENLVAASLDQAHAAWSENPTPEHQLAWFRFVIGEVLALDDPECWRQDEAIPVSCRLDLPGTRYLPQALVVDPDGDRPRLLIARYPLKQNLDGTAPGFDLSPLELMARLCLHIRTPLGLVTNGENWVLVHALADEPATYASFAARDWLEERDTLRAFINLLHRHRFFAVPPDRTPEALFRATLDDAGEVTETLGRQVREAVEILVRTFDQLDLESGRKLLNGQSAETIYEAVLTVMMRLVLVFCAEDRGLFPRESSRFYADNYALSNLRAHLRRQADRYGEELLERGCDAWHRLLACFRLVHGGLDNPRLTLPAYGSSLFDPERFPFLEGRLPGRQQADPPRVDNRTVLHLLEALQVLRLRGRHTRLLDFQTLGPEEIGHVYEGLLDHTAKRAAAPVLGLIGTVRQSLDMEPEIPLDQLETQQARGLDAFLAYLKTATGKSANALAKALAATPDASLADRLRAACGNDPDLLRRVTPFAGLLRRDSRGTPFVVTRGGVYVTAGTDRRNSGTHYTPRALSEETVQHTLDPLVYDGPARGLPEAAWTLRAPEAILDLKICDPAMGSGAFLVQACRYLSAKLVQSWQQRETLAEAPATQPVARESRGAVHEALLGAAPDERMANARRLVCTRCLYGVDKNPMAVEMAKLSLWLITLDAGKPFTFLDHHLRHGDSLLGVAELDQLRFYHTDPRRGRALHRWVGGVQTILADKLATVLDLRTRIESESGGTIVEVNRQEKLAGEAAGHLADLQSFADALVGAALLSRGKQQAFENALTEPAHRIEILTGTGREEAQRQEARDRLRAFAAEALGQEARDRLRAFAAEALGHEPLTGQAREPFHWVLAFPEVFQAGRGGFDAVVGNPPFLGGKKITGPYGNDYRDYLVAHIARGARGNADLCAYFYLRAYQLLRSGGTCGFIATNTIAQGDTREVGLDRLLAAGCSIYRALPSRKWPGSANLEVAQTWLLVGAWKGEFLLAGVCEKGISSYLSKPGNATGQPHPLVANKNKSFIGSYLSGKGFILPIEEATSLIERNQENQRVLFPYLNGEDLNTHPEQSPIRWVINFFDWPLNREAQPQGYEGPVAADFPDCLRIVEEKVKPVRTRTKNNGDFKLRKPLPQRWWHYADKRPALYQKLFSLKNCLVVTLHSKYLIFAIVDTNQVFSHGLGVITLNNKATFALLHASFHESWVRHHGSSLETRLRYTPESCFETLPFPEDITGLYAIGAAYHTHRQEVMEQSGLGLTATYNRFHDPGERASEIAELRRLHRLLDEAVGHAYGWNGLTLGHDFHDTAQGRRYTLAPAQIDEILDRLLTLNHARYAEEVARGLHPKEKKEARPPKPKPPPTQLELDF